MTTVTAETIAPFAVAAGIALPPCLDNFSYNDAPLFHSICIATACRDMTDDELARTVNHAATLQPDCAATLANFIDCL